MLTSFNVQPPARSCLISWMLAITTKTQINFQAINYCNRQQQVAFAQLNCKFETLAISLAIIVKSLCAAAAYVHKQFVTYTRNFTAKKYLVVEEKCTYTASLETQNSLSGHCLAMGHTDP